jgi:ankyrin repeat protein
MGQGCKLELTSLYISISVEDAASENGHDYLASFIHNIKEEQVELKRVLVLNDHFVSLEDCLTNFPNKKELPCLLNFQNSEGKNALYFAAEAGWNIHDIENLVSHGADFNIVNQCNGKSFIEHAFDEGKYDVLSAILTQEGLPNKGEKIKKSLNSKCKNGESLFDKVLKSAKQTVIEIFKTADAKHNEGKLTQAFEENQGSSRSGEELSARRVNQGEELPSSLTRSASAARSVVKKDGCVIN